MPLIKHLLLSPAISSCFSLSDPILPALLLYKLLHSIEEEGRLLQNCKIPEAKINIEFMFVFSINFGRMSVISMCYVFFKLKYLKEPGQYCKCVKYGKCWELCLMEKKRTFSFTFKKY